MAVSGTVAETIPQATMMSTTRALFLVLLTFLWLACDRANAQQPDALTSFNPISCGTAGLSVDNFQIVYYRFNRSFEYTITATADRSMNASVSVVASAYGKKVPDQLINLCQYFQCPFQLGVPQSTSGKTTFPESYTADTPSIIWSIPDLDATARFIFYDGDNEGSNQVACVHTDLSNGITANKPAVPWVTGAATIVLVVASGAAGFVGAFSSVPPPPVAHGIIGGGAVQGGIGHGAGTGAGVAQAGPGGTAPTWHIAPNGIDGGLHGPAMSPGAGGAGFHQGALPHGGEMGMIHATSHVNPLYGTHVMGVDGTIGTAHAGPVGHVDAIHPHTHPGVHGMGHQGYHGVGTQHPGGDGSGLQAQTFQGADGMYHSSTAAYSGPDGMGYQGAGGIGHQGASAAYQGADGISHQILPTQALQGGGGHAIIPNSSTAAYHSTSAQAFQGDGVIHHGTGAVYRGPIDELGHQGATTQTFQGEGGVPVHQTIATYSGADSMGLQGAAAPTQPLISGYQGPAAIGVAHGTPGIGHAGFQGSLSTGQVYPGGDTTALYGQAYTAAGAHGPGGFQGPGAVGTAHAPAGFEGPGAHSMGTGHIYPGANAVGVHGQPYTGADTAAYHGGANYAAFGPQAGGGVDPLTGMAAVPVAVAVAQSKKDEDDQSQANGPPAARMDSITLFLHFQFIATSGLLSLNYPSLYRAFTLNFAWANFIVPIGAFRRQAMRMRLCNLPTAVSADSATPVIPSVSKTPPPLELSYGIPVYAAKLRIDYQDVFTIIYFMFLCVTGLLLAVFLLVGLIMQIALWSAKTEENKQEWLTRRARWQQSMSNNTLRLMFVALGSVMVFGPYQLTQRCVSPVTAFITASALILTIGSLGFALFFIIRLARRPGGVDQLYDDDGPYARKWGALYLMLKQKSVAFAALVMSLVIMRGVAVGLGQKNGLAQAAAVVALEVIMCFVLFWSSPYYSRGLNRVGYMLEISRALTYIMLLLFAKQFNMNTIVTTILGFVLVVMNSLVALVLVILTVIKLGWGKVWKRKSKASKNEEKIQEKLQQRESDGEITVHELQ